MSAGQVFGTRMNEVILFSSPRPIRIVHKADGWTPEDCAAVAAPALKLQLVKEIADLARVSQDEAERLMEAGLRRVGGRAILNSANLEEGDGEGKRMDRVFRLAREHGAAVICVTHDPRLEAWADRVIHIEDGKILDDQRRIPDPNAILASH